MARKLLFPLIVFGFMLLWEAKLVRHEPGPDIHAIGALISINKAQFDYAARAGSGGYAVSFETLTAPCPGSTRSKAVSLNLDGARKAGYVIRLRGSGAPGRPDCNGAPTRTGYYVAAEPDTARTGRIRAFATDQSGDIWTDARGIAPKLPFAETANVKRLQ